MKNYFVYFLLFNFHCSTKHVALTDNILCFHDFVFVYCKMIGHIFYSKKFLRCFRKYCFDGVIWVRAIKKKKPVRFFKILEFWKKSVVLHIQTHKEKSYNTDIKNKSNFVHSGGGLNNSTNERRLEMVGNKNQMHIQTEHNFTSDCLFTSL